MQSVWSNEWFGWYISDHFFKILYFVLANVLINQSDPLVFSFLVKQMGVNIPEHKYTWIFFFSLSQVLFLARVLLWHQVVTRLTSDVLCPKGIKVQSSACVLHGQIQVQAYHQNWCRVPKYTTQQQIWCETISISLSSTQKP